ncbi:MAG: archease [Desulfobacterales bacterium]
MKYRIIDHTADLGLHVFGADPSELFATAARAMFDIIVTPESVQAVQSLNLKVEGADWPDLMVNWLRELLYLWSGKGLLVHSVVIHDIGAHRIIADVAVDTYDPARHALGSEIKAVTYHQITVKRKLTGWEARIIFDV